MRLFLIIATFLLIAAIATIVAVIQPPALMSALGLDDDKGGTPSAVSRNEGISTRVTGTPKKTSHPTRQQWSMPEKTTAKIPTHTARTTTPSFQKKTPLKSNDYEPGEVVVADPPAGFSDTVRTLGFTITEKTSLSGLGITVIRLRTPRGMSVEKALRLLNGKIPGLTLDANHHYQTGNGRSHARDQMGWAEAPANCGQGLRIGMIDTSVDLTHPALKKQNITFKSFHRSGRKPGPADHGTSIAAIIAGRPDWGGLVPGAKLFAANMFETSPTGKKVGTVIGLLKSFDWLTKQNVHVINLSIAGSDNKILRKAIGIAQRKNLILVAAAGNQGADAPPAFPAGYQDAIAVTAITTEKTIYNFANQGDYIEFAAPGVHIWTAVPGGGRFQSGTSFASPYIATLVAQQVARDGKPDIQTIRNSLKKVTIDLGKKGHDKIFGWGLVSKEPLCN